MIDLIKVVLLKPKAPPLSYISSDAELGDLVLVPIRNRVAYGIVIDRGIEKRAMRRIRKIVIKNFVSPNMLQVLRWISDYYLSPIEDVIRMAIPKVVLQQLEDAPQLIKDAHPSVELNRWQQNAFDEISLSLTKNRHRVYLLYGITGSGKTEVYINLILKSLEVGKGAILLYPEIALTPLYVSRLQARFPTAILHSGLSQKERRKNWHMLRKGIISVAIGARSAIFAPNSNIGVIIIDEEHSTSYKEEFRSPRYHARDVAINRGKIESCPVILGSATPSIETFHKAIVGDYVMIRLPQRIKSRPLPVVKIVDLKREKEKIITNQLNVELQKTIKNENQAIIFINRKGYAPVIICENCSYSKICPRCGIHMVYYQKADFLKCPYCSYQEQMISVCPRCHKKKLRRLGSGTERIEERMAKYFGKGKILRFDRDQAYHKLNKLYTQFQNRDRLMMVGTTLVTKGHDFPFVTLVGVINGDQILNFPDFRAGEFTFQTLTQVAGRAGRGVTPGSVIVQTYQPEHPVFNSLKNHDYQSFYANEIQIRKELDYPPFCKIVLIRISGSDFDSLMETGNKIKKLIPKLKRISILGPTPAFRKKIGMNYRVLLMIKIKGDHRFLKQISKVESNGIKITIDVNPISVL